MNWELKKVLELVKGTVVCIIDGEKKGFASGQDALEKVAGKHVITSICVEDNAVALMLEADSTVPNGINVDWVKSLIEKYGKEPNLFDEM
ncbi:MAG TPA: hypothetical protein H9910_01660 [Candidatus Mediterraneibacter quadrami]|uniref:Uncharacterized protein n=1 Tax=Candidatus Mediterraneibacter quadrami TaxID=2838684 RepID=A0A9D2RBA9_9FIRM|nr:hypothetical protein [Candidatus Mediterraneibacter quadrami]